MVKWHALDADEFVCSRNGLSVASMIKAFLGLLSRAAPQPQQQRPQDSVLDQIKQPTVDPFGN